MTSHVPLIDHDWITSAVQRYAESNMRATVRVSRPTEPVLDEVTGQVVSSQKVIVYEGKARVYPVGGPIQMAIGDEPQFYSSTYVSLPMSTSRVQVHDVVEITGHQDPQLVGRVFTVEDVETGSQWPAVVRLQCRGAQPAPIWSVP